MRSTCCSSVHRMNWESSSRATDCALVRNRARRRTGRSWERWSVIGLWAWLVSGTTQSGQDIEAKLLTTEDTEGNTEKILPRFSSMLLCVLCGCQVFTSPESPSSPRSCSRSGRIREPQRHVLGQGRVRSSWLCRRRGRRNASRTNRNLEVVVLSLRVRQLAHRFDVLPVVGVDRVLGALDRREAVSGAESYVDLVASRRRGQCSRCAEVSCRFRREGSLSRPLARPRANAKAHRRPPL